MKTIKLNFITYEFAGTTGTVLSAAKSSDTHVFGNANSNVGISSTVVVNDNLFLLDKNNKEHSYQLANFNVACRQGNTLTVVETRKPGKRSGRNLVVINHSTEKLFFHKYNVKRLCAPNRYLLGAIVVILSFLEVSRTHGRDWTTVIVLLIAAIAYYFIMEKVNEHKLKEAIVPADYLETNAKQYQP